MDLSLSGSISGPLLCSLFLLVFLGCCIRLFLLVQHPPPPPPRPRSPRRHAIFRTAPPGARYVAAKDGDDAADGCAVCLHGFEEGDEVPRLGSCMHVFHAHCLDRWVELEHCTCPLCRGRLTADARSDRCTSGFYDGDDDSYLII